MNNPSVQHIKKVYIKRSQKYRQELSLAERKSRGLSSLRLLVFLGGAAAFLYGVFSPFTILLLPALLLAGWFVYLVVIHSRLNEQRAFLERMVEINERAVLRLDGGWTAFPEDGEEYTDHNHPYASDLNIFGPGSLFQFISVPLSFGGRQRLVQYLQHPPLFEEITPRQEAVADLAPRLDLRQKLQATARDPFFEGKDPRVVLDWLEGRQQGSFLPQAIHYLPVVTLSLFALALAGFVTYRLPLAILALQALVAFWGERAVAFPFQDMEKPLLVFRRYEALLKLVEGEKFASSFLKSQQKKLFAGPLPASRVIEKLVRIAERNDIRYSNGLIYLPLNIAVLWDLWTLRMLNAWKDRWGSHARNWFQVVAEVEALSCLSGPCYDNPDWVFPQIRQGPPFIDAKNMAHPLIPAGERVGNDLSLPRQGKVLMITGSNMSGKSTLLRTAGINLVLAYAGSPVCAGEMACGVMNIYCKMQVHDDLKERTSTFYAELKRMKQILDAAKTGEPMLFLLDEIFRGTNSRDRITATRTVIRQLHKLKTIGLVTTHDLELGSLAEEYPGTISNYHFTDAIKGDQIHFDFKLRPGISKTANAIALMRIIGIE